MYVNDDGYVRCELRDPHFGSVSISVSDHRFFEMERLGRPKSRTSSSARWSTTSTVVIRAGVDVLLGLCVNYVFPLEHPHQWLRVCGIHLRDDPLLGMTGPRLSVHSL